MDLLLMVEIWLALAVIFGLAELVIPGGISLNLSLSSLLVSLGLHLNVLSSWVSVLTTWFLAASCLFFVIYFFTRRFNTCEVTIENAFEEVDLFEQEVEVVENIGPGNNKGRVVFQGTTWSALSDGREIPAGSRAKIICQDNISLVVQALK